MSVAEESVSRRRVYLNVNTNTLEKKKKKKADSRFGPNFYFVTICLIKMYKISERLQLKALKHTLHLAKKKKLKNY